MTLTLTKLITFHYKVTRRVAEIGLEFNRQFAEFLWKLVVAHTERHLALVVIELEAQNNIYIYIETIVNSSNEYEWFEFE